MPIARALMNNLVACPRNLAAAAKGDAGSGRPVPRMSRSVGLLSSYFNLQEIQAGSVKHFLCPAQ
jgi:hypothetical protein